MVKIDCKQFDEQELVEKSLQDLDYFRCIIEMHELRLFRFIKRMSGLSDEDIDDILQETFVRAYRNLNQYIKSMRLQNWLFQIARNQMIDMLRKGKHQRQHQAIAFNLDESIAWHHLSNTIDQEQQVIHNEQQGLLLKAIDQLAVPYREAAILRFVEDKSYQEMSDITRKPIGTISTLVARAKGLIMQQLASHKPGEGHEP